MSGFSPIQNDIIRKLKNAKILRYGQIHPKNIPNDLFNYHLQFLVKKGFLDRSSDGYKLSPKGIRHVADPITDKPEITSLFKVNVITILSRIKDDKIEILNQIRQSNPSYGKIGVMGGIVRKGETVESAAVRKLKSETGLDASNFKVVAMERRMMYVKNELFSDIFFPITYTDRYSGELINTEFGENMWLPINEAIKNESDEFDSIVSIKEVLKAIRKGSIKKLVFSYEETVQSDS